VHQARRVEDPGGTHTFQVRTTASIADTTAYRQQIRRQITAEGPTPDGGIALQLAFVVGPRRAWANLWRATIDSLDPLLGSDGKAHERKMRDGRITDLGLHCIVDPTMGHEVITAVRVQGTGQPTATMDRVDLTGFRRSSLTPHSSRG
jgi:hypothetical protein